LAEAPLEARFRDLPADAWRPSLALPLGQLSSDPETLSRQLVQIRALGAGGLLVRMPTASDAVWTQVALLADACRRLGLELGVSDFALSMEEQASRPRTQRLLWSSGPSENVAGEDGAVLPSVFQTDSSYHEIARLAVPVQKDIPPLQVVELSAESPLPTNGLWRVYRFGCADLEPALPDCFNGDDVFRHVNSLLFSCQSRLARTYGTTLSWCQMRGPGQSDVIWPRDLPAVFVRQSGLGLTRHLPALAGVPVGGESTAAYVRQQVGRAIRDTWRERYAENVNELVHEAGLEAGIGIDEVPMDPEEIPLYFRRPLFTLAQSAVQRERNVRAAGGARVLSRRFVVGHLTGNCFPVASQALPLRTLQGDIDRLLTDGATRILMELTGEIPEEGQRFAEMSGICRYTHRCQLLLQSGEPVADFLVWSAETPSELGPYACDFANRAVVATAVTDNGRLRFDSERTYSNVVVTAETLREKASEKLARQLLADGVTLWLLACGQTDEESVFNRFPTGATCRRWGAAGEALPVPDFEWTSEKPSMALRFVHRRLPEAELYFVANVGAAGGSADCVFRDSGRGVPERWDPVSGEINAGGSTNRLADGRCPLSLSLPASSAVFVVFKRWD
jgi:hypothetical protein